MYPAGLKEMLGAALAGLDGPPATRNPRVAATRESICGELRSFGEDAVAEAVERLPTRKLTLIFDLAGKHLAATSSKASVAHSLCLAAVQAVERKARPLARTRRRRAS